MIRPNNTISVVNPEIYIFKKIDFFIESVDLIGNEKEMKATLHCCLKSCYDRSKPVYIYEGINQH